MPGRSQVNFNTLQPTEDTPKSPLAVRKFPSREERPCYRAYAEPFTFNGRRYESGTYFHHIEKKKEITESRGEIEKEQLANDWFLSYLEVRGIVHTSDFKEYSYLIDYLPHGETTIKRVVFPQALLVGRLDEMMRYLRDIGVSALSDHKQEIRAYLDKQHLEFDTSNPDLFWISTKLTGWHSDTCFVLPSEIIGPNGDKDGVWFDGNSTPDTYGKKGDFQQWKNQVAAPCVGNRYLMLALSAAFVGPLLVELNEPGAGFHFYTDSTTGKTTAQLVGASAWGSKDFVCSWRTTDNALEAIAASRSDTFTVLDESHQAEPKHLDAAAYLLLNQKGKARLNRDATPKPLAKWRTCVLSSGERSIEAHLARAKIDYKAGQCVRIIDIDVAHGSEFGLFDDLHGAGDGNEFSAKLRAASAQHYGFAGPEFVAWLLKKPVWRTALRPLLKAITKKFQSDLNPQEERIARTFCFVALAGELAIQASVLPWTEGTITEAVRTIFDHWRANQSEKTSSKEHVQILEMISNFISRHGDTRFTDIHPRTYTVQTGKGEITRPSEEQPQARDRAGYWENDGERRLYLFTNDSLKEATKGQDFNRVLRTLAEADAFYDTDLIQKAKVRHLPTGGTARFYHIDPDKLSP
jgi:putative DNA primase/helicase